MAAETCAFKCCVVLQSMSQRRQSLQRILRMRRPATTTAKQRIRSVRRKKNGTTSRPAVAIDSFVEDSQGSLSDYSARKPRQRTVPVGSENASAKCRDMPGTAVKGIEEDQYNLLESTEELELPCRGELVDEMRKCSELNGNVTIVSEMSHVVSDAHNASTADDVAVCDNNQPVAAACPSMQTPQPLPPPDSDVNHVVYDERPATSSRQQRLSSLPTLQLDGQQDTPASTVVNQSSAVDKVDTLAASRCFSADTANVGLLN